MGLKGLDHPSQYTLHVYKFFITTKGPYYYAAQFFSHPDAISMKTIVFMFTHILILKV